VKRLSIFLVLLAASAGCQPVSVGIKAGVPLNTLFEAPDNRWTADTPRWTAGPTIELNLRARFSIGLDALYRRGSATYGRAVGSAYFTGDFETAHWEFPLYLKYRFGKGPVRPFVNAGVALDYARTTTVSSCGGDVMLCSTPGVGSSKSSHGGAGVTFGGGVELKAGRLKIAPELRFTLWQNGYFSQGSLASYSPGSRNQAAILAGIRR